MRKMRFRLKPQELVWAALVLTLFNAAPCRGQDWILDKSIWEGEWWWIDLTDPRYDYLDNISKKAEQSADPYADLPESHRPWDAHTDYPYVWNQSFGATCLGFAICGALEIQNQVKWWDWTDPWGYEYGNWSKQRCGRSPQQIVGCYYDYPNTSFIATSQSTLDLDPRRILEDAGRYGVAEGECMTRYPIENFFGEVECPYRINSDCDGDHRVFWAREAVQRIAESDQSERNKKIMQAVLENGAVVAQMKVNDALRT
ncbi:MAG: hypothetical protein GF331_17430, partial [Chitinivibrionales bacterium]|nr:hypothetical protein [Chitinivibrionales bacterium]